MAPGFFSLPSLLRKAKKGDLIVSLELPIPACCAPRSSLCKKGMLQLGLLHRKSRPLMPRSSHSLRKTPDFGKELTITGMPGGAAIQQEGLLSSLSLQATKKQLSSAQTNLKLPSMKNLSNLASKPSSPLLQNALLQGCSTLLKKWCST